MSRQNILLAILASLLLFSFTTDLTFGVFSSLVHRQISEKKAPESLRYILTGGPGAGKTSVLLKLEQLGQGIVREAATDVTDLFIAQGHNQPWMCPNFDEEILKLQSERQAAASYSRHERIFFDRSPLDALAYAEKSGKADALKEKISHLLKEGSYAPIVFVIENFGTCQQTAVRHETISEALELQKIQEKNYREKGFNVVLVPPASIEERAQFILAYINEYEKASTHVEQIASAP